jgi:hypothetical protein
MEPRKLPKEKKFHVLRSSRSGEEAQEDYN